MNPPIRPPVRALTQLSPSLYEAALQCRARATWMALGDRDALPHHPRALLGIAVHAVVEAAHRGELSADDDDTRRQAARDLFDRKARQLHEDAHPLIRAKFKTAERLPFYNLFRERATAMALRVAADAGPPPVSEARDRSAAGQPRRVSEVRLVSKDGLLVGRSDHIAAAEGEVVDYKTSDGPEGDPTGITEAEARQLRLYVHLGLDNDLVLKRGVVVRSNGARAVLDVSAADAAAEGKRARDVLRVLNADAGRAFEDVATPSATNCRNCPCIPFCGAFWKTASAAWAPDCGTHAEGVISEVSRAVVQGAALLTLELRVDHGTVPLGVAVLQQMPEEWATAGGAAPPKVGDRVRAVNCRLGDAMPDKSVLHPDRVTTALWAVETEAIVAGDTALPTPGNENG